MLVACGDNIGESQLEVDGLYYVESSFQTPRGLPEHESEELDSFLDLANRPDRASAWFLEVVENQLDEPYSSGLRYLRDGGGVEEELQAFLEEQAPEFVEELSRLAADVKSVTTSINLQSELTLTTDLSTTEGRERDGETGTAEHRITGMKFRLGSAEYVYGLAELGIDAPGVMTTDFMRHDREVISFGRQNMNLAYGRALDYAINEVIVENADPFADSFTDLMTSIVPCDKLGDWIGDEVGGPSELYGAACSGAFDQLAKKILPLEMDDIDITVDFSGDAILDDDADSDLFVDRFVRGEWEGTLAFPTEVQQMLRPYHTFSATRSRASRNNDDDLVGR